MLVQNLVATNDVNGNPRRLWVIMDPKHGDIVKVIDEGYGGRPAETRGYIQLPSYEIKASMYNYLLKAYGN